MTPERQKELLAFAKALRGTPSTAMAGVELLEAVNAIKARDKTIADLNTAVDELTKQGEQYIEQRNTRDKLLRKCGNWFALEVASPLADEDATRISRRALLYEIDRLLGKEAKR